MTEKPNNNNGSILLPLRDNGPLSSIEKIKTASDGLRGTIVESL
jgi:hypothetical protein